MNRWSYCISWRLIICTTWASFAYRICFFHGCNLQHLQLQSITARWHLPLAPYLYYLVECSDPWSVSGYWDASAAQFSAWQETPFPSPVPDRDWPVSAREYSLKESKERGRKVGEGDTLPLQICAPQRVLSSLMSFCDPHRETAADSLAPHSNPSAEHVDSSPACCAPRVCPRCNKEKKKRHYNK